jgi:coenzyme F420-reducing hydrogenase beta subunit
MEGSEKEITMTIDGKEVNAIEGTSILHVAKESGIKIPTLCYNEALEPFGSCRVCSVEITDKRGRKKIVTSCNYPVVDGLVVETKSEKVFETRQMLLELLLARCPNAKKIQDLAREYGIEKPSLWVGDPEEDCILCGLCARVCDERIGVSAINFANRGVLREITTPYHTISDDCVGCGACAIVCPTDSKRVRINTYPMLEEDMREAEKQFLKGTRDEFLGVYNEIIAAKTSISGQDGGMATALLLSGFEKGLFDAAIVVKRTAGYKAEAFIVESADEILSAKGTKYSRVKMMSKIGELVETGKRKIAFVGTPCEIRTGRKIQQQLSSKHPDLQIIVVGLFCFEAFNYNKLKEATQRLLGVDLDKAEETRIQKGMFLVKVEGKEYSAKVKMFHDAIQGGCLYCNDFTGRIADVSVGSVGSDEDYSTVIVRSDIGKKLLMNVECTRGDINVEEVIKLAQLKKKKANKKFSPIIEGARDYKEL